MSGVTRYRKAAHTRRVNRQKLVGPHRSAIVEHDKATDKIKVKVKFCAACERDYRIHHRVSRFFPRWTCRGCGAVCCEHMCSLKQGDAASCGNCQMDNTVGQRRNAPRR